MIRTVEEDAGERLDVWLARRLPDRARHRIQQDIRAGRVRVDGRPRPPSYRVRLGERIDYEIPPPPEPGTQPEAIPLRIVFEDEHLLIVDKPAGMVVHPAPGHPGGTLVNALLAHCGPSLAGVGGEGRWGIVHRLDQGTSGLMAAAKTPAAYAALVHALADRRVRRRYVGIAVGRMPGTAGTVDRPIGRRPSDRKRMGIVPEHRGGRPARTDWRLLAEHRGLALVGLALHTGRTHQIRVHLQALGRPILGDAEYGWTRPRVLSAVEPDVRAALAAAWPQRPMLHAARLALAHPIDVGTSLDFVSPPPEDMVRVLAAVMGDGWRAPLDAWLAEPLPPPEPASGAGEPLAGEDD